MKERTGGFSRIAGLIVSLALFIFCLILVNGAWIGSAAVSRAAGGAPIPDMQFTYSADRLVPMFEALGAAGRAAYLVMNSIDFAFAVAYGLFYFLALKWIALKLFPSRPTLQRIALIGIAAALADETENVVYRLIAGGTAGLDGSLSGIAAAACPVKFGLVTASMILIAAGLAGLAFKTIRARFRKSA